MELVEVDVSGRQTKDADVVTASVVVVVGTYGNTLLVNGRVE